MEASGVADVAAHHQSVGAAGDAHDAGCSTLQRFLAMTMARQGIPPQEATLEATNTLQRAGCDGATDADTPQTGRCCVEHAHRITRRGAATVPAAGATEAPGRRDDEQLDAAGEPFEYPP